MSLPRLLRSALASPPVAFLAGLAVLGYIRLVAATSRWDELGRAHGEPLNVDGKGVILAFWHGRLMMGARARRETTKRVFMLSSTHRDGEIMMRAGRAHGVEFIRGSAANPDKPHKDKRGAPALAQMIGALENGHVVAIAPDGPRGPRGVASLGIVRLAQLSGAPILPTAYSVSRGRILDTWDGFLFAFPFSRGCFAAGPPIRVPKDAGPERLESARRELEAALNAVTAAADAHVGRPLPPSPDARPLV